MCGENALSVVNLDDSTGSPPHVRGKLTILCVRVDRHGITPACAGKTLLRPFLPFQLWDHPRMCGENCKRLLPACRAAGSPPHVRGKRFYPAFRRQQRGITPACAGKTAKSATDLYPSQDHPRMCGENQIPSSGRNHGPGSPPHVRGKPPDTISSTHRFGITPACAGKTPGCLRNRMNGRDHPRMCGENAPPDNTLCSALGSPPHVRGKLILRIQLPLVLGITPACAGKTF